MILRRTMITIGLMLAAFAATAQNYSETPPQGELENALRNESTLFRATIADMPDESLLKIGRLVAMGGAEQGGADMACISCHLGRGQGDSSGAFPRLAGQAAWYTYKQLMDYASGARPNDIMSSIAKRLTEQEMEAVAAYYAVTEAPYPGLIGEIDGKTLQWGAQLGAVGSAERGIPACTNCHGANGAGLPPSVPYLAGQYANYMHYQLELWQDGVRNNDALNVMSAIANKMTTEDMRAVSEYYARIRTNPVNDAPPVAESLNAVGGPGVRQRYR